MSRSTGGADREAGVRVPAAPITGCCYSFFSVRRAALWTRGRCLRSVSPPVAFPFVVWLPPSIRDDAGRGQGRACGVHLQVPRGAGPPHVGQQVGVAPHLVHVHAVFLPVGQAAPDEGLQNKRKMNRKGQNLK